MEEDLRVKKDLRETKAQSVKSDPREIKEFLEQEELDGLFP